MLNISIKTFVTFQMDLDFCVRARTCKKTHNWKTALKNVRDRMSVTSDDFRYSFSMLTCV